MSRTNTDLEDGAAGGRPASRRRARRAMVLADASARVEIALPTDVATDGMVSA